MGRAGALGAVLGLSLVAVFVVGARVAYHSRGSAVESATAARTASAPSLQHAVASDPAPVALSTTMAPAPGPAEQAPAWLRPQVRSGTTAGAPRVPAATPTAATVGATTGGTRTSSPKPATSAVGVNVASATADPAEADSAAAMIPVIPPSPPTEVDPLVQAVQHDIEEDRSHAR